MTFHPAPLLPASTPAFATRLDLWGDRPALILSDGRTISHAGLGQAARAFAARLPARRALVAIEAAADPQAVAAIFGAWAGGHAVLLLPEGDAAAQAAMVDRFAPEWIHARRDGGWRLTRTGTDPAGAPVLHPALALLLVTSGSTGKGKAVRLSGAAVEANARQIAGYMGLAGDDRAALVLPLHYSYGLSVLTSHLFAGGAVWLDPGPILAPGFTARLADSGATTLATVPHGFDLLDRIGFATAAVPTLRRLACAGGALAPERIRARAAEIEAGGGVFLAMYGQTEATARIAWLPPHLARDRAGAIGIAVPGGELSLRAADGSRIETAGTEGELVYRGPNVMMGYAESRADLARGAELDHLRTGDLAVRDPDGLFRITGRLRRMSKIAGFRIGHDALEAALAAKGIGAVVTGDDRRITVHHTGPRPCAEIAGLAAGAAGLTPAHVVVRRHAELPRLASGKPDLAALARAATADQRHRPATPTRDDPVLHAFRACFHPRPVGPGDSFAALGGDSLRHLELALVLEERLGRLPPGWEEMAVAALDRAAAAPAPEGPAAAPRLVASEHLLRAVAILAVVVAHETHWPVHGGAAVMVLLMGLMLARFQRAALARGDLAGLFRPLGRVLAPYYLILAAYALVWQRIPWGSVALVSNFGIGDPARHDRLPFLYWFVEAYAQMLVLLAGLALIGPVRRLAGRDPFRFGLGLLAGAVVLRLAGPPLMGLGGRALFTVPWVLYLLALGWLAALARTPGRRRAVLGLAAVVLCGAAWLGGNWHGSWIKYLSVLGAVAMLLYLPAVALPRRAASAVMVLAASSYAIYLTHRMVPELLIGGLRHDLPAPLFHAAAIAGGLALGLAAQAGLRALPPAGDRVLRMFARLPAAFSRAGASPARCAPAAGNAP